MSINSATSRRHALTGSIMLIAALGLMFEVDPIGWTGLSHN